MNFRRWVVFTFLVHLLVVAVDKGAGLVLYLLTADRPEQKGAADLLSTLPFILMAVGNLGLATGLVYHVRRKLYTAQQAAETTTLVAVVWGGFVALVALAIALFVLPFLGEDFRFDPWLIVPICASIPLLLLFSYGNSIQLAMERIKGWGMMHLLSSVSFLPAFFLCYWALGSDISGGVAWGRLLQAAVIAGATMLLLRGVVRLRPRLHRGYLADNLRYGWKANVNSVLTYLNHRLDIYVLGVLYVAVAGKEGALQEVAFYSMAVTFAELVWHFPEAMRDLFFSKVAGSTSEQARTVTPVLCRLALIVSLLGGIAVYLLVDPLMPLITRLIGKGEAWGEIWSEPVRSALLLLIPGTVGYTVAKVLQADLAARNHLQPCVNAGLGVLCIMLTLDALLIREHGASGAAVASSVAYLYASVYTLIAYRRSGGARLLECLVPRSSDWSYVQDIARAVLAKLRRKSR